MRDPRWSSLLLRDCNPWKGLTLGRAAACGRDPTLEQGTSARRKERQTMCDELTMAPAARPPALLGGRR